MTAIVLVSGIIDYILIYLILIAAIGEITGMVTDYEDNTSIRSFTIFRIIMIFCVQLSVFN